MTNKPKAIGTAAETAVKRVLLPYFPEARRNALAGNKDEGDIGGCGDFMFEVKGGEAAKDINAPVQLAEWLGQTEVEKLNAAKPFGVLVTQRRGFGAPNADRWWAWIPLRDLAYLLGSELAGDEMHGPTRMELRLLLDLLVERGYAQAPSAG